MNQNQEILVQIYTNPINWILLILSIYLIKLILESTLYSPIPSTFQHPVVQQLQDFTLAELLKYDGDTTDQIYLAVKGYVFDVSKSPQYYGKDGAYGIFRGRDASRGLAKNSTQDLQFSLDEIDSCLDLSDQENASLDEWFGFFKGKYDHVGYLI